LKPVTGHPDTLDCPVHLPPSALRKASLPHARPLNSRWLSACGVKRFQFTKVQDPKIDGFGFWDQSLCVVFDADSPISSTGIDKIKDLSILCIKIIFTIFIIHRANRPWLKGEVVHATK
jgi:hypothetical protein